MSEYDPEEELAANAAYRRAVRETGRRAAGQQPQAGRAGAADPVLEVAVIGSVEGCALVLDDDPQVALRHVEVRRHAGGGVSVRPLATGGLAILRVIGGRRRRLPVVSTMALERGDVLQVGSTRSAPWVPR